MTADTSSPTVPQFEQSKFRNGARFYKCALQVNPFAYLGRNNKKTAFSSEDEYNKAIIDVCLETKVEVVAVTDHYLTKGSECLVRTARNAGLYAFSGFEAVTKDGVHFLCLFDPDKDNNLERFLGECGIHNNDQPSPTGILDSVELPEHAKKWGAACIAAHVASNGGLLRTLSGQPRVNAWRNPGLLACALPGPVSDAPDGVRTILENKDANYRRNRMPAVLNVSDVNDPEDLKKDSTSCFIKMSAVSVEGLRQAFLDPESRIRLHSDPNPEPNAEFLEMSWEGGFLSDAAVKFNKNLNVLIGGRGTGKSTMIESIRYVLGLDPVGKEAGRVHEGVIRHVLQPGTKVSLIVRSHEPSKRTYRIERTVPNPPIVKDEAGEVMMLSPEDVIPGVEVFGQHEISELAKSPENLTLLLKRFIDFEPSLLRRKSELSVELEKTRRQIADLHRDIKRLEDVLAELPGLEETDKRFQQAGLEERFKEKSLLIREERLFSGLDERMEQYRTIRNELADNLPADTVFVSSKAINGLPNEEILAEVKKILESLSTKLESSIAEQFAAALAEADTAIREIKSRWNDRRAAIEEAYEKLLREFQNSKIDCTEFIHIRQQIEELIPSKDRRERLKRILETVEAERRKLLAEWEGVTACEYRKIKEAAHQISKKLQNRVQVGVTMAGNRELLEQLLRDKVGGNLSAALERLRSEDQLSLRELAKRCREGKESLMNHYNLPPSAAERIAQSDLELFMEIEELDLTATTEIELNTARAGDEANWQRLEAISTGQKATAVILLLLLESKAPLIIDQPEDDLDNRFITEGIVPIIRQQKQERQFVFSTHNANIPVLGDAELILGLTASGEAGKGHAEIADKHMGSIDLQPVRELVEEILEGGKDAFEVRRSKYGF